MKKIIAIILCIALCLSDMTVVMAENEQEETYCTINAEFSDKVGQLEKIQVMVKDDHVYANAEELATRLGYKMASDNECVLIYNQENKSLPYGFTQFYIDDTKVTHTLFTEVVSSYEAPFETIKKDKGAWIPLEYSLLILNSGMMMLDNTVLIDIPQKDIIDICFDIVKNNAHYTFEWAEDFGYTEGDVFGLEWTSRLVNLLNGALKFDSESWAQLFNNLEFENVYYNKKYGEDLALLICTQSAKELDEIIEDVENAQNLLSSDGELGETLSSYSKGLDDNVGKLYEQCEELLEKVKNGNTNVVEYNRSYQALEEALDKQTWFSDLGGDVVMQLQSELSGVLSVLDIGTKIAEIVKYGKEFQNQDSFALQALLKYLEDTKENAMVSEDTALSMIEYSEQLQENVLSYSVKRWWDENIDEIIGEAIKESLGTQANVALIAWDLASSYIPILSSGLAAAENFELALYATALQYGAFDNSRNYRVQLFEDISDITPENLYKLAQYYYIYLKSCYITREAAVASLAGKMEIDSYKEKLQPLVDYQNAINTDIAEMLVKLKDAETNNDKLVYGFLPEDNVEYLEKYDDNKLIEVCFNQTMDIMNYLSDWTILTKILGLENNSTTDSIIDARKGDKFSIYCDTNSDYIYIGNSGDTDISVDGVKIGDSIENVIKLLDNMYWLKEDIQLYLGDENVDYLYYTTFKNGEFYGLHITYSIKDGIVTAWDLSNSVGYETVVTFAQNNVNEEWKKQYIDLIVKNGATWEKIAYTKYQLVDINNDEIPELYVHYGSVAEGDDLYSYANNSLIYQHMSDYGFSYIEGQNCFLDSGGRYDSYYDKLYVIDNGQFVLIHTGEYDVIWDSEGNEVYNYYWDGVKILEESEYMQLLQEIFDKEEAKHFGEENLYDSTEIIKNIMNY